MDGRTKALIAHITIIGWVISLVLNSSEKDEFASYYIRQLLGIYILFFLSVIIPLVGWVVSLIAFVLWIFSLIGAAKGEQKEIPYVGQYFQDWFKAM